MHSILAKNNISHEFSDLFGKKGKVFLRPDFDKFVAKKVVSTTLAYRLEAAWASHCKEDVGRELILGRGLKHSATR